MLQNWLDNTIYSMSESFEQHFAQEEEEEKSSEEIKAQPEQEILRRNTERIINELGLNLSFLNINTEEVKGKKRILVSFDFNSRLQGITDEAEKQKERLNIVNDIVKVLTYRGNEIKDLSVTWEYIGDTGAKALAEALKHSKNRLEKLFLGYNEIGPTGAKALAEALKHSNNRLEKLDVRHNKIGDTGAKSLAQALKDPNNRLESLSVAWNNIGDTGAEALAQALRNPNNKLESLNVRYNNIGDTGAEALAHARDEIKKEGKKIEIRGI